MSASLWIPLSSVIVAFGIAAVYVDIARPSLVDRFNTTRQLLKHRHLGLYLDMKREQCEIEKRIGALTRKEASAAEIEAALVEWRYAVNFRPNSAYWKARKTLSPNDLKAFYESLNP